ncbi:MAG: PQQ-binding-like beta-propeller repeat protein [Acidobacteriota bacterium]|nr:PQQ-binding-like beta-propeller repeat protein [Acidobacteriota bacterium]
MKKSLGIVCAVLVLAGAATGAAQWPEWRGPSRDGRSAETNLPSSWSPAGENLAWRIPIGGRATPVAWGNRIYLQTTTGDFSTTQERLVAIDADSGKVAWERRFSQYLSDVPQNRAAWAPPAVDPETGTIYVFTVSAELIALAPDGKVLWTRSLPEEYGAITTHGGRTVSPVVDGDKVILNALILAWGSDLGRPGNRYFAFNKRTGETMWVSSPQARHYDTNYSTPIVAEVNGMKQLIVGGTDGQFYGLKANTGEKVWQTEVSKRAILNSALYRDGVAYITHGEENIGTTEMGMVAAVDATKTGQLAKDAFKWVTHGFLPTFSSPVLDGDRLYSVDNGAIVAGFDVKTGQQLWQKSLGTLQKGSPVLADGKLYVGTENGKVYILRPSATGVDVLDEDALPDGSQGGPEPIVASPIVAGGRVIITSMDAMYAIGPKTRSAIRGPAGSGARSSGSQAASTEPVAHVQVFPHEALLNPGETRAYSVKLFDAKGSFIREDKGSAATWALDGGLGGAITADGTYTAAPGAAAGFVKATIGGVSGTARVRVIAPLPWAYDFEGATAPAPPANWIGASSKVTQRTVEGLGGVLVRARDDTQGRRAKIIIGRPDASGLTVEADVRGRVERRQRGDAGIINQRYILTLFGNSQKLELQPWQAADEMTVKVQPFAWNPDTWYRMKLRVDNLANGDVHVRGKVWPAGEPEPAAWTIEKMDKIGHRHGAPGIYADGISEMYFDNVKVFRNQ